jgi:hypothetical protein
MKLNLERLNNIQGTLGAIKDFEKAMNWYGDTTKAGPAYLIVKEPGGTDYINLQIDRQTFLDIMREQKAKYIRHLEERFDGFEYDPDAHWSGDR